MKIISDLPNYILNEIRKLVEEGKYQSISNFLLVAAENQLTLESGDSTDLLRLSIEDTPGNSYKQERDLSHPSSNIPSLKPFDKIICEDIWENWLWGQINRLLPIKFAVRFLAIETVKLDQFPNKEDFNLTASKAARYFGNYLKVQDEKLEKARDEKLSTGFPISAKKEKSLDRYWSHFIGYQRGDGSLTGALFDLGFANVTEDPNCKIEIGLTESGIAFSKIENPVIDKDDFNRSLGDEEREFYINHIMKNVPGEVSLFALLLEIINRGVLRREPMNNELRKIVTSSEWSDGLVSTQRSGAISRMYEVGLITKKRIGLKVQYLSTDMGNSFLRRTA